MKYLFLVILQAFQLFATAQKNDSAFNNRNFIRFKPEKIKLALPATLFLAGGLSDVDSWGSLDKKILEERNEDYPTFKSLTDNYLQYAPIIFIYSFDAIGMKARTDIKNRTIILLKSELLMAVTVTIFKKTIHELRPDASARNSFPSGHTAMAFVGASVLTAEYGHRYKWVPYLAYTVASSVGMLRILNNKHYLSDVLVGAGIGILSTKIAYYTHRYKWGKRKQNNTVTSF